jgi:hypothetical protein
MHHLMKEILDFSYLKSLSGQSLSGHLFEGDKEWQSGDQLQLLLEPFRKFYQRDSESWEDDLIEHLLRV